MLMSNLLIVNMDMCVTLQTNCRDLMKAKANLVCSARQVNYRRLSGSQLERVRTGWNVHNLFSIEREHRLRAQLPE